MAKANLMHLTPEQHKEAARLMKKVQEDLGALGLLVSRGSYTDETLRVRRRIQEKLIDPLSNAWDSDMNNTIHDNPYSSANYVPRR